VTDLRKGLDIVAKNSWEVLQSEGGKGARYLLGEKKEPPPASRDTIFGTEWEEGKKPW